MQTKKYQPPGFAGWKVMWPTKTWGFILWGLWMFTQKLIAIHVIVVHFSQDKSVGSDIVKKINKNTQKNYNKTKQTHYKGDGWEVGWGVLGELDTGNGWAFVGLPVLDRTRVKWDCKNASLNRQQRQHMWLLKEKQPGTHMQSSTHTHRCSNMLKTKITCK